MNNPLKNMSSFNKGIILMIAGILLLLYVLGILAAWVRYGLIIGALFMIVYGFMEARLHSKIMKLIKNKEK